MGTHVQEPYAATVVGRRGAAEEPDGVRGCGEPAPPESIKFPVVSRILVSRPGSGSSSHSSGPSIARGLERPTRGNGRAVRARPRGRTSLLLGLAPDGVYRASALTDGSGELLPHRFTLAPRSRAGRSLFCGTFPRSLGAAVSGHPALRSPDFPPAAGAASGCLTGKVFHHHCRGARQSRALLPRY